MIALLLVGSAFGQSAEDCGDGGFPPIAGTSGLTNAKSALRVNQKTYSASAFAEKHLFAETAANENENAGSFAYELNSTYNAAAVPVFINDAVHSPQRCPEDLRVALSPLDLQSINMGFAFRSKNIGAFYSASVTYGALAHPHNYVRGLLWGLAMPMFGAYALTTAPVLGGTGQTEGGSAFVMDWIGGILVQDETVGQFSAGYAGASRGFYLHALDNNAGLFGSAVLGRPDDGILKSARGGLDKFDAQAALLSLFYRDLPFAGGLAQDEDLQSAKAVADRFRSGHANIDNIGSAVDLRAAYAFEPTPLLNQATVGLHTANFHQPRGETALDEEAVDTGVEVGMVEMPDLYSAGVQGDTLFSARGEVRFAFDGFAGKARLLYNDPEQLVMFPYARNVLSYGFSLEGAF